MFLEVAEELLQLGYDVALVIKTCDTNDNVTVSDFVEQNGPPPQLKLVNIKVSSFPESHLDMTPILVNFTDSNINRFSRGSDFSKVSRFISAVFSRGSDISKISRFKSAGFSRGSNMLKISRFISAGFSRGSEK